MFRYYQKWKLLVSDDILLDYQGIKGNFSLMIVPRRSKTIFLPKQNYAWELVGGTRA